MAVCVSCLCSFSMAGDPGWGCRSCQTVVVILVLYSVAQSSTCFSLRGLGKSIRQGKVVGEATVMEVRRGSILFNGKELDSQSGFASATGNVELLHIDLDQSDGTGMLQQMPEPETNEAAWRQLNPSLHCHHNKMKLTVTGPGVHDLKLDMGNTLPLPLLQVPESCSYTTKQYAQGLVLVVPYDGCNVIQENGNYVLPMSWLETPVKFICPILPTSATTPASTTPKPAQQPWDLPAPHGPWRPSRHKRHVTQPLPLYDPSLYYAYLYHYYMHTTPAPTTATTTAKPDTTTTATTTTKPDTTTTPTTTTTTMTAEPTTVKPVYPYPYFDPYYYYYYYYHLYHPHVHTTTAKPTTASTTASASTTTASASTTTASASTTTASASTTMASTTASASTTTASASTTLTPQTPQYPYYPGYPGYFPFHHYYPFPGFPNGSEIYYYPIIQHYHGKPPYPYVTTTTATPTSSSPATASSATTASTASSAMTASTSSSATTASSATTTSSAPTTQPTTPSGVYPGPFSPFVPYYTQPFIPVVSYKSKIGKFPDDQKYMPQAGYKSGFQVPADPAPYWQPVPWFQPSMDQDNLQFDWRNLQPNV